MLLKLNMASVGRLNLELFLVPLLLALVGCATPVGVRHLDHEKAYRTLTASVLSGKGLSETTVQLVNRAGLAEAYQDAPADVIADLHKRIATHRERNLLFALAELSFQQGERSGDGAYFLGAAVYAYAFLFPKQHSDTPDPFDPRFRTAVDLYNQGLIRGFSTRPSGAIEFKSGNLRLPFGKLQHRDQRHPSRRLRRLPPAGKQRGKDLIVINRFQFIPQGQITIAFGKGSLGHPSRFLRNRGTRSHL